MSEYSMGPGWWQASDGRWYPPESHPDAAGPTAQVPVAAESPPPFTGVPPAGPSTGSEIDSGGGTATSGAFPASGAPIPVAPAVKPGRRVPLWLAIAGPVVALFLGVGIGSASQGSETEELKASLAAAEQKADRLQRQVDDRESKASADAAAAKRAEQDRLAAEQKAADDQRKAAEAAADQQRKAADAAAAEQRRQQEAAAAEAQRQADAAAAEAARRSTVPAGGGVFAVGSDIDPGRYRTAGPEPGGIDICYYAILSAPSGFENIDDNNVVQGPAIVDLPAGKYFETNGCQPWTKG